VENATGFATAPVLVLVGALMLGGGLAFGFLSYVLLKGLTGRWREVHPITVAIAAAFAVNFAFHG
jgi:AGZA family xanthine/uracil permease-like MFS transporter